MDGQVMGTWVLWGHECYRDMNVMGAWVLRGHGCYGGHVAIMRTWGGYEENRRMSHLHMFVYGGTKQK